MAIPAGAPVSIVSVLSGPTTRTWTISHNAKKFTVQLFHNTITGERNLCIDGAEVSGTSGTTSIFSTSKTLVFELPGGGRGYVKLHHNASQVEYLCSFNDVAIPEDNSILNGGDASKDSVNKMKLTVDGADVGVDEKGKAVAWFRVHSIRENDERETIVHRRFRDFFGVNEALRSAYKGSHLLASFPELPPRSFKLWEDHLGAAFIDKRRWQLQDWLYKISQIPRMRTNPDFLIFLGCIDNVREVSVLFPPDVALGITLRASGDFVDIAALKALADGGPSPAQASGMVKVGDKISKINGEDCLGDTYEVVVAKLKSAPRPMMVHFLGLFTSTGRADDEDLASVPVSSPISAPPPVSLAAFVHPAEAAQAPAEEKVVTGLIGEGVSFIGTGATPRPGAPARTGLSHHAAAEAAARAEQEAGTDNAFNGLL